MTDEPNEADEKPQSWLRENVEAIVVAIVLALLIRQYAMEAFVIPTGSMAPTLLGAHVDLVCTNCGKPQPVAEGVFRRAGGAKTAAPAGNAVGTCPKCKAKYVRSLPEDAFVAGRAEIVCEKDQTKVPMREIVAAPNDGERAVAHACSNCGTRFENKLSSGGFPFAELWPSGPISRGDRILVDKFSYKFTSPQRYEVMVFKFPRKPEENFIKRLIGLPEETIDVRAGDIYVDGAIARKPRDVQEECWRPIWESRYVEKDAGGEGGGDSRRRALKQDGGLFDQTPEKTGYVLKKAVGSQPAWLVYNREIKDWNAYNEQPAHSGGRNVVGDVRVAFDVTPGAAADAAVLGRLTDDDDAFELEIAGGKATVRRGRAVVATATVDSWRADGAKNRVDFGRADARVTLDVNGKRVISHEFAPVDEGTKKSEVRLGVRGGDGATFDAIAVYRDVYYLSTIYGATVEFPYKVGEHEYFVMGDNSSNSTDSRVWETVPEGHLVGRAFMVFWPAVPGDFAVRRIR